MDAETRLELEIEAKQHDIAVLQKELAGMRQHSHRLKVGRLIEVLKSYDYVVVREAFDDYLEQLNDSEDVYS